MAKRRQQNRSDSILIDLTEKQISVHKQDYRRNRRSYEYKSSFWPHSWMIIMMVVGVLIMIILVVGIIIRIVSITKKEKSAFQIYIVSL